MLLSAVSILFFRNTFRFFRPGRWGNRLRCSSRTFIVRHVRNFLEPLFNINPGGRLHLFHELDKCSRGGGHQSIYGTVAVAASTVNRDDLIKLDLADRFSPLFRNRLDRFQGKIKLASFKGQPFL